MKTWALAVVGALSVLALFVTPWIVAYLGRHYGSDDVPISKPRYRYLNADEGLRERTAKRRQAADAIRKRAAKVDSGNPVFDVLRMVK